MDHSSTGPLFTRFPNQEYCNGLPCPPPGDLPHSRIEPRSPKSPALQEDPLLLSHGGSPFIFFSWAQLPSRVQLFVIPWTVVHWVSFSITNSRSLLKLTSIKSAMPSNHLILCCPSLLLPYIFPSIRVFLMSQFFTSGGQGVGVSASAWVLPLNIQDWSPLGWTGWISLQSQKLSRVFFNTTVQKHQLLKKQQQKTNSINCFIKERKRKDTRTVLLKPSLRRWKTCLFVKFPVHHKSVVL